MAVEFVPHVGISLATGKEVTLPQDIIMIDGVSCGYFSHKPGKTIALIREVSESELAEIDRVATERAGGPVKIGKPPRPLILETDETEPEEDEDDE